MAAELPSEWRWSSVADLAEERGVIGGPFGSKLVRRDFVDSGIPVIRGQSLGSGRYVDVSSGPYVTPQKSAELSSNQAVPGDVILTQRGTLGQVAIVPPGLHDTYVVSQSQMRIRCRPECAVPLFLYYALSNAEVVERIHAYAIRTGVPHINLRILRDLHLPLPPLAEQHAIAEVLGALDDRIEWCDTGTAVAHNLARSVAEGRESEVTADLGELAKIERSTVSTSRLQGKWWTHYSIPAFDEGQQPQVEFGSDIRSGKFAVPENSVLVSKLNPTWPRVWLPVADDEPPAICSTELMPLVPHATSATSTASLWASLLTARFNSQLRERVSGSTGSHQRVRPEDMLACRVMDPVGLTPDEADLLVVLAERVRELRVHRRSLVGMRDALLPRLLSGELRIEDPAHVLGAVA